MIDQIAINGRFQGRRLTGVDRYATEALRCFGDAARVVSPKQTLSGVRGHLWEQFVLPNRLARGEVLWSPANTGPLAVGSQVVTIHDLSVLEHPEWFAASFHLWYRILLPSLARRARAVLTVSEHSRRAILQRFKLAPAKVTVVPNGVNLRQFHPCNPQPVREKYGLAESYILFVGSLDPRKNLQRLLQAWDRLAEFRHVELVIAGSRTGIFRPVALGRAARRVHFLGYVPDEDLTALYAGSTFFIMPSLLEGFGLTVLEAMACGAPVIASNRGGLPEVADRAAMQVDPTSVESLAEAMRTLLLDEGLRARLRQQGMQRACEYSWERSAEQIWNLLTHYE